MNRFCIALIVFLLVCGAMAFAWTNFVCPRCGSPVDVSIGCSIPPVTMYRCTKCGWSHWERDEVQEIVAPGYLKK